MGANTENIGTSHPQQHPEDSAAEVENANTMVGGTSGRAGGKSATMEGNKGGSGGPAHG